MIAGKLQPAKSQNITQNETVIDFVFRTRYYIWPLKVIDMVCSHTLSPKQNLIRQYLQVKGWLKYWCTHVRTKCQNTASKISTKCVEIKQWSFKTQPITKSQNSQNATYSKYYKSCVIFSSHNFSQSLEFTIKSNLIFNQHRNL